MVELFYLCTEEDPKKRPSASQILQALESNALPDKTPGEVIVVDWAPGPTPLFDLRATGCEYWRVFSVLTTIEQVICQIYFGVCNINPCRIISDYFWYKQKCLEDSVPTKKSMSQMKANCNLHHAYLFIYCICRLSLTLVRLLFMFCFQYFPCLVTFTVRNLCWLFCFFQHFCKLHSSNSWVVLLFLKNSVLSVSVV